jgi:hypothetical protein
MVIYYSPGARSGAWRHPPRAIVMRRRGGGIAALFRAACGFEKCLCSRSTPRHLALGTLRARETAGGNRSVRGAGKMHHANVNLKSRHREIRCGHGTEHAPEETLAGAISCLAPLSSRSNRHVLAALAGNFLPNPFLT